MLKKALIGSGILLLVFLAGCTEQQQSDLAGKLNEPYQKDPVVVAFYDAIKTKDYASLEPLFSSDFLQESPLEDTVAVFKRVNEKIGGLKSYEVTGFNVQKDLAAGTTATELDIKTIYANGTATENIQLIEKSGEKKIGGWRISIDQET